MEWESVSPEILESQIREVRNKIPYSIPRSTNYQNSSFDANEISKETTINIVIDTNVVVSSLDLVKTLISTSINNMKICAVIPWQVLCELDGLKESSNSKVASRSRRASAWISEKLSKSHPNLKSQSPNLHKKSVNGFDPEVADDYIILAALQLKEHNCTTILLTNDFNLIAKGKASGVSSFPEDTIEKAVNQSKTASEASELEKTPPKDEKCEESIMVHHLSSAFKNLLSLIVEKKLKELHGGLWVLFVVRVPPWSLLESIRCARAAWDIICSDSTSQYKQLSLLNSIEHFFTSNDYSSLDVDKLHTLFDECCTFATSLPVVYTDFANAFISQAKEILEENLDSGRELVHCLEQQDVLEEQNLVTNNIDKIIDMFDAYIQKYISLCVCVYRTLNLEWPIKEQMPESNISSSLEQLREFLPSLVIKLNRVFGSVVKLGQVEVGQVMASTEGVADVHHVLTEDLDPSVASSFTPHDFAYFFNSPQFRSNFEKAIDCFKTVSTLLEASMRHLW